MVSMKDVAKLANVSTATVSHVINGTRYVKKETKDKVLETMRILDYTPNVAARNLRSQKSNIVGLIVPDISNYFFTSVIEGIESALSEENLQLIISNSKENIEEEIKQLKIFAAQQVRGLIVASTAEKYSQIAKYIKDGTPTLFIDRVPSGKKLNTITAENHKGAYEAVDYLIKKGHRKIGMITGIPTISGTKERLLGYKDALRSHNIEINEKWIKVGDSKFQSGYQLAGELLKEDITAVFIANNLMTIGAMKYFKEQNIAIPDQLAFIGFDDYEWATITTPTLSVIRQPSFEMGVQSAKALFEMIQSKNDDKLINYVFSTKVIIRESS